RGKIRSRADRTELLKLEQVRLLLGGGGYRIPRIRILAPPLRIGGNFGSKVRFFLCLLVEECLVHTTVFAGICFQAVLETENPVGCLPGLLRPSCRKSPQRLDLTLESSDSRRINQIVIEH